MTRSPGRRSAERVEVGADHLGDLGIAADGLPVHAEDDALTVARHLNRPRTDGFRKQLACRDGQRRLPSGARPIRLLAGATVKVARIEILLAETRTPAPRRERADVGRRPKPVPSRLIKRAGILPETARQSPRRPCSGSREQPAVKDDRRLQAAGERRNRPWRPTAVPPMCKTSPGMEREGLAGGERPAVAGHVERGAEQDAGQLRVGDEGGAGEGDFQGGGVRRVADEGVAEGEGGAVGGAADGHAQAAVVRPAPVHDERRRGRGGAT